MEGGIAYEIDGNTKSIAILVFAHPYYEKIRYDMNLLTKM